MVWKSTSPIREEPERDGSEGELGAIGAKGAPPELGCWEAAEDPWLAGAWVEARSDRRGASFSSVRAWHGSFGGACGVGILVPR